MEIVVVLYIVGIALIMGYLINRYPRERVAIIFLCAIVVLQVIQKCHFIKNKRTRLCSAKRRGDAEIE